MQSRIPSTIDTTGLLSRWLLDGSALDYVGGRNGTWTGTAKYTRDPRLGGQVVATFGGSSYISFSPAGLPSGNDAGSMCLWIKHRATGGSYDFLYGAGASNQFRLIRLNASNFIEFNSYGTVQLSSGINPLSSGSWFHVAAVHNGTTTAIYVNGVLQAAVSATLNTTATSGRIGAYVDGTLNTVGSCADCRIYSTAKSAAQILAIAKLEA